MKTPTLFSFKSFFTSVTCLGMESFKSFGSSYIPDGMRLANTPIVASAQRIGKRDYQEDRLVTQNVYVGEKAYLLVSVFDGHSGPECSQFLYDNIVEFFVYHLKEGASPKRSIYRCYKNLEMALVYFGVKAGSTGSTVIVDLATGRAYYAHVGDSRILGGLSSNRYACQYSVDHNTTNPREAKRVIEKGGFIQDKRVNGILEMTRAFGDRDLKAVITAKPDVGNLPLSRPGEAVRFIVVGSDGLFERMNNQSVVDFVYNRLDQGYRADAVVKDLVNHVISLGTDDNVSAVIIFL